jgi:hypothetical protein
MCAGGSDVLIEIAGSAVTGLAELDQSPPWERLAGPPGRRLMIAASTKAAISVGVRYHEVETDALSDI